MIQAKPTVFPFLISFLLVGTFAQAQNSPIKNSSTLWHQVEAFTSTIVVRPDDYDSTIAHTLVIALHGFGGTSESFLRLSEPFTDAGFIYAAPEAPYPYFRSDGKQGYDPGHGRPYEQPAAQVAEQVGGLGAE